MTSCHAVSSQRWDQSGQSGLNVVAWPVVWVQSGLALVCFLLVRRHQQFGFSLVLSAAVLALLRNWQLVQTEIPKLCNLLAFLDHKSI